MRATRRAAIARLVSVALGSGAATPVWAQAGAATTALGAGTPLELLPTGDIGVLLVARVTLGGASALMVLDTGATTHAVDPQLAAQLSLPTDSRAAVALPGGRSTVLRVTLPPLRFAPDAGPEAGPVFADQKALELDLAPLRDATGADIRGLLGMPLWRQRATSFDLRRGALRFDTPAPSGEQAFELPLQIDSGLPTVAATLSSQVAGRFLFDTGNAGAVLLFAHRAQALAEDPALPLVTVQELGGSVSARYARSSLTTLGLFTRSDVPIALELGAAARRGGHFDRLAGSLGCALFDGGEIWLDVGAGRLVVQHPGAGTALPGGFGFVPRVREGRLLLGSVFSGGPAALAGLQSTDQVLMLGGLPAPASAPACWQHLRGREEAALVLGRGGQRIEATLRRAAFFPLLG